MLSDFSRVSFLNLISLIILRLYALLFITVFSSMKLYVYQFFQLIHIFIALIVLSLHTCNFE